MSKRFLPKSSTQLAAELAALIIGAIDKLVPTFALVFESSMTNRDVSTGRFNIAVIYTVPESAEMAKLLHDLGVVRVSIHNILRQYHHQFEMEGQPAVATLEKQQLKLEVSLTPKP